MIDVKQFYRNYQADNKIDSLGRRLVAEIMSHSPVNVFEFGCGSGKNLAMIKSKDQVVETYGMDISIVNVFQAHINGVDSVTRGDERHFPARKFDVVFTCSVLDHIEDIKNIIGNFELMAKKAIYLAETNSFQENFYWRHDYESYGFKKLDYLYRSKDDKGIYHIWKKTCAE